jgi:hypothetical protein
LWAHVPSLCGEGTLAANSAAFLSAKSASVPRDIRRDPSRLIAI